MATSKIKYPGDLRTKAIHLQSGNEITTDAPVDNEGKGEFFSPTDLLATSLGSCMMTIIGIAAKKHNFDVENTEMEITKIMGTDPRRVIKIIVDFKFPHSNYSEKEKKIIKLATETCPVAKSLHPDIIQEIHLNF